MDLSKPVEEAYQRFYDALKAQNSISVRKEVSFLSNYLSTHTEMFNTQIRQYLDQEDFSSALDVANKAYDLDYCNYINHLKLGELINSKQHQKYHQEILTFHWPDIYLVHSF